MEDLEVVRKSPKEIYFKVPWGVIAAKSWGPTDGKPFLGLHGWLDNANTYDKLVHLLPEGICFIAIDFPGHGKSSHRWPGMPYIIFEYVADVKKIVSQLAWHKFSIIGHNMGANIASLYAGTFPHEVEHLILIEYAVDTLPFEERPAFTLARYATKMSYTNTVFPHVYESVEEAAEKRHTTLRKEDAMLLVERGIKITEKGIIFSHSLMVKDLVVPFIAPQWAFISFLSKIQCAVLVLEATPSVFEYTQVRKAVLERLKVICQYARSKTWKRITGGHYIHLEKPKVVAEEIKEFLAHFPSQNGIVQSKL